MERKWIFDVSILCPMCGAERIYYSNPTCKKTNETLNEKYFIILKFTELEYKIKELEKKCGFSDEEKEQGELSNSESGRENDKNIDQGEQPVPF